MGQLTQHSSVNGNKIGLKAQIGDLLKERVEASAFGLTIGEIGAALSLPKTDHNNLSAALVKLREEGKVKTSSGPATSSLGPRFVKRYVWRVKQEKTAPLPTAEQVDDRRFLSLCK